MAHELSQTPTRRKAKWTPTLLTYLRRRCHSSQPRSRWCFSSGERCRTDPTFRLRRHRAGVLPTTSALTRKHVPAVVDSGTAGRAVGLGLALAHDLARHGDSPVPVLRVGRIYSVAMARVRNLLAIDAPRRSRASGT